MDISILLGASALFAALFALYSILRARRENEPIGLLEHLLAIIATIVLVVTLVFDSLQQAAVDNVEFTILGFGLLIGIIGLLILRNERRSETPPRQSRGWLGLGVSILVALAAIGIPFFAQNTPDVEAIEVAIPTPINAESPFADTSVAFDEPMPTQTPVELLDVIPTPVMPRLYFLTPTPMPENVVFCEGEVTVNANVRSYPAVARGNIDTVAVEGQAVTISGRTAETDWWYLEGEEVTGWVSADLVEFDEECRDNDIPVRQWRVE